MDHFKKHTVTQLDTSAFNSLPEDTQHLVYHLIQAGMYGRDIVFDQNSKSNLVVKGVIEKLVSYIIKEEIAIEVSSSILTYARMFWAHCGIHNDRSGDKIQIEVTKEQFDEFVFNSKLKFSIVELDVVKFVLFNAEFEPRSVDRREGKDLIADSAMNYYQGDLTYKEVTDYYDNYYPKNLENSPVWGLNSTLKKVNGKIIEKKWCVGGRYSGALEKVVSELTSALKYVENDNQKEMLETLITYYQTGNGCDFDLHSIAWLKDNKSMVYFVSGFVEDYKDPIRRKGSFESIVAVKADSPEKVNRMKLIASKSEWLESLLPIDESYKRGACEMVEAIAANVLSMSGDPHALSPLGINLPNNDWIKSEYGNKSVAFANVGGGSSSVDDVEYDEFFLCDIAIKRAKENAALATEYATEYHEIIGHGCGTSEGGVINEDLKEYYSELEEARADLVALYLAYHPDVLSEGLFPSEDSAKALYDHTMSNGVIFQLKRIDIGSTIGQAHLRNRALISNYVLAQGESSGAKVVVDSGKSYVVITDYRALHASFGSLLKEVQRIKSQGDYAAAKLLVDTFAVNIDLKWHQDVMDRYSDIDYSEFTCHISPLYLQHVYENGDVSHYSVLNVSSFAHNQNLLSEIYSGFCDKEKTEGVQRIRSIMNAG